MKHTWKRFAIVITALAGLCFTGIHAQQEVTSSDEKLPPGAKLVRIEATPAIIDLQHRFEYRQLLLTGVLASGETVDVTRMVKLKKTLPCVSVNERGMVQPLADGSGTLKFNLNNVNVNIPVTVTGQQKDYSVSFVRDIMPIMGKVGCNAGTCHGAAKGKNGFRLSLRGYDPAFDHRALTDDVMGRRFDRSAPDRSLMLLKSTNEVPHVGGMVIEPGDRYYRLIHSWIADGVKFDAKSPRVQSIEILPKEAIIPLPEMKQQTRVVATYTDGSTRDVTAEAFVESSNTEVAKVDDKGLVRAIRRGETALLARYEGAYAVSTLIVMGDRSGFAWQPVEEYNYIDTLVYEKLKSVKVLPSGICSDSDFVRRLYLDLTGLPPTPQQVRSFLSDKTPSKQKREALVDKLVGSPEYVDHWTNKWADLLQVNSNFLGMEGARKYREFIRNAVAKNMPYDQFAYQILTAEGSNMENPAAAYWKILREPQDAMENTTHLFLAVRFNCNKCHDHPFERWTQNNYYETAAFFAQFGLKPDPKYKGKKIGGTAVMKAAPLVEIVYDKNAGEIKHDHTGELTKPRFPFTHGDMPDNAETRREALAQWITSEENPYFAKSYVNRIWSYLLGVGLIEPVDDIRAGNPPTNPKLLARMTEEFIDSGFDVQKLIRTICKSRTYQHSISTNRWNEDDKINYSHAFARRLRAEVLYDSVHAVMDVPTRIPGLPPGARAAEIVNPDTQIPGGFLKLMGQPPRESACECERTNEMQLGPVLNMISGPVIANAINDPNNRINKLLANEKDNTKVVKELFLAVLNRAPTKAEIQLGLKAIQNGLKEHKVMLAHQAKLQAELRDYEKQLDAKQPTWEADMKRIAEWVVLEPETLEATGATLTKQPDNSILASEKNPTPETYTITLKTDVTGITGIRLEALTDTSLPKIGPGRAPNGNFVLTDFKLFVAPTEGNEKPKQIRFKRAIADHSQGGFAVQRAIDNNPGTGWAIGPQFGKPHTAVFETQQKVGFKEGTKLIIKMDHRFRGKKHNIGKFRLSLTTAPGPLKLKLLPDNIVKILHTPDEKRSPQQQTALQNYYRSLDPELGRRQQALARYIVPPDPRAVGAQDLCWAMINSPAFLFNH